MQSATQNLLNGNVMSSKSSPSTGRLRLAVVTDAHIDGTEQVRASYLKGAMGRVETLGVDLVVFAGDLAAAHSPPADLKPWFQEIVHRCSRPAFCLRGNTDTECAPPLQFEVAFDAYAVIGVDTATGTFSSEESEWLTEKLKQHADRRIILVTHCYIAALDESGAERLTQCLRTIDHPVLICGHGHRAEQMCIDGVEQHLVAAIDPFKPGCIEPGIEIFEFSGHDVERTRHAVTLLKEPQARQVLDCLGCAVANPQSLEMLGDRLEQLGLRFLQIKYRSSLVDQLGGGVQLGAHVRRWQSRGLLRAASLHASTPVIGTDGVVENQKELDTQAALAEAMNAESVTVHLPTWDERLVFDQHGEVCDAGMLKRLVDAIARAVRCFHLCGIRIDLENTHWYDLNEVPSRHGEHQLGIRIHHLQRVRSMLNERLGEGAAAFCLDVGHALTNGPLASTLTLKHWFEALAGGIGSLHFHNVIESPDGARQGHQPFALGQGLVNLEALAYLHCHCSSAAPLYLELEDWSAIDTSVKRLRQWVEAPADLINNTSRVSEPL